MKFWELVSIFRGSRHVLESELSKLGDDGWLSNYRNFAELVKRQDRSLLDQIVPEDIVTSVLQSHGQKVYMSGGYLRLRPIGSDDEEITCLDVYRRFNSHALEDLLESGLRKI